MTNASEKPCLALLHGWGLGREAWAPVAEALTVHYDVRCIDLPGYGDTPADPADFSATAARLADALPPGSILCGWSLGAMLALQMAHNRPERFRALYLVGATACFTQQRDWPHGQSPTLLKMFMAAVKSAPADTLQRFIALLNQGDAQARANTRAQQRALPTDRFADTASLLQGLEWLWKSDLRGLVATISIPTLLIHGENDPLMPLPAAQWLADHLPDAQLEIFRGAAHAPFLSAPERFAELLIDTCHALRPYQATRS
ncbi:alpha/beta fold hydrolase [uncultured Propionivibrio sp.]|uniref:alpha/beta fold hydrolase n=1 Tax=uncultured Propionivibrio sp. TaxID=426737 RepID=UPI0029BFFA52|nr:alpha/beta fold hydrolase [uncultured Propionivibrio sp.]